MMDLDKLEVVANAATPGPWTSEPPAGEGWQQSGGEQYYWSVRCPSSPPMVSHQLCRLSSLNNNEQADAQFIAAARTAVPELIALVRKQAAELAEARRVDEADLECQVPPFGWRCTRGAGHDGPCAAAECPEDIAAVKRGMERLAAQPAPANGKETLHITPNRFNIVIEGRTPDGQTIDLPIFGDGSKDGKFLYIVALPSAPAAPPADILDVVKYTRLARGIQNPAGNNPDGPWEDFYACDDVVQALAAQPSAPAVAAQEEREFTVTDPDLQAFLDAAVGWVKGEPQNMDTGLHLMSLLERVEERLAPPAPAPAQQDSERFYMDHGLWHDRVTGQHMWDQDQYDERYRDGLAVGRENAELAAHDRLVALEENPAQQDSERKCEVCQGNDGDAPCAYPSENMVKCLRRIRLTAGVFQRDSERDAARLDWLQQVDGRWTNIDRITSIVGKGFQIAVTGNNAWYVDLRAAIDAAMSAPAQSGSAK